MDTDHAAQSRHNDRARTLMHPHTPLYLDWEITIMFYSALHLIDKRLADLGKSVRNHHQRFVAIKNYLPDMYPPYYTLYSPSIGARYEGVGAVTAQSAEIARRAYGQLST